MVDARVVHSVHPYLKRPIRRRNLMRVIPLQIVRTPVVQIHRLPVWIISRPERPPFLLEFVAKNENELFVGVVPPLLRVSFLRCVTVDETVISWEYWDLARCIYTAKIETALGGVLDLGEVGDERVA